jgi:hypothetical protein
MTQQARTGSVLLLAATCLVSCSEDEDDGAASSSASGGSTATITINAPADGANVIADLEMAGDGGALVVSKPFDKELGELNGKLNKTYASYGHRGAAGAANQTAQDSSAALLAPAVLAPAVSVTVAPCDPAAVASAAVAVRRTPATSPVARPSGTPETTNTSRLASAATWSR